MYRFFDTAGISIKLLSRETPLDFCQRWYAQFDAVGGRWDGRLTGGETPEEALLAFLQDAEGKVFHYRKLRPAEEWQHNSQRDWFDTSIIVPKLFKP